MPGSISLVTRSKALRFANGKKFANTSGKLAKHACLTAKLKRSQYRKPLQAIETGIGILMPISYLLRNTVKNVRVVICNEVSHESKSLSPMLLHGAVAAAIVRCALGPVSNSWPRSNSFRTHAENQRKYAAFGSIH